MLIDEVEITITAGKGGDGLVHFYTDRWRPKGGPDGGNGGMGGSVYFKAVSDISRLQQFRHQKKFLAENGQNGRPKNCTGKNGSDLVLEIPYGSIIYFDNGTSIELDTVGQTVLAAKGGKGGLGNHHYRSATNQTPEERTLGFTPTPKNIRIELKLIADIGLVGLPNAGKSSLLNELTAAGVKVANYPFTTLEPNLGVTRGGKIIADIPGLIEGASSGKGLGFKFLKHIIRTKLIIHCLPADSSDPVRDYQEIRRELENYSSILAEKQEILIITKSDLIDTKSQKYLKKLLPNIQLFTSILDTPSLKKLSELISISI